MKTDPSEGVTPIKLQSEKSTKQRAHIILLCETPFYQSLRNSLSPTSLSFFIFVTHPMDGSKHAICYFYVGSVTMTPRVAIAYPPAMS